MEKFVSIHLDKKANKPLYLQLYQEIVRLIENGLLKENEKLPPIRKLAKYLEVNSITVINAYKLLEKENYIKTKVGSGTYISSRKKENEKTKLIRNTQSIKYDFATASLSPDLFPVEEFKTALIKVLDTEGGYAFDYEESSGYRPLRDTINKKILLPLGIEAEVENIYIVSGGQQGIEIIAKALLDYQDTVYIESPTYPGAISAFRSRLAKIIDIPIREDGIDITELRYKLKLKVPKLLYIMTNFQNPTGYSYSEDKKKEILKLAEEYNFFVLEDDHTNELYYFNKPTPLKTLDRSERVFYLKSFSKLLMPGLRLGFIVSPKGYDTKITEAKYLSDISSSSLMQKVLNIILNSDDFDRHIIKIRDIFLRRWKIMSDSLKKFMPREVNFVSPKGGLYVWLTLPRGYDSRSLFYQTINKGITFIPGDAFLPEPRLSESLRLSFAQITEDKIEEGIKVLSDCIRDFLLENQSRYTKGGDYRIFI